MAVRFGLGLVRIHICNTCGSVAEEIAAQGFERAGPRFESHSGRFYVLAGLTILLRLFIFFSSSGSQSSIKTTSINFAHVTALTVTEQDPSSYHSPWVGQSHRHLRISERVQFPSWL
uniref:Uncharacterized protein n=1 Tax=Anopheles culicifacies TaxID=139723 RepID=A0A182MVL8_9DIPT